MSTTLTDSTAVTLSNDTANEVANQDIVLPAATLSANARTVLAKRYLIKDESGNPTERPEDLFWRVAVTLADVDRRYGASVADVTALASTFYQLMTTGRFEPNSPTLMNAGRPLGMLSACFVLPVEDTLSNGHNGIYDTLRSCALVHQAGGGTGMAFSRIRPRNSMVKSTTGVASGPVSFMELYDASTDAVRQGGVRRGANMGVLRVDHPDVMEFIGCKEDLTRVTNFNISVAISDEFMAAVRNGSDYALRDPRTRAEVGRLDARTVWDAMIDGAWRTGEPGCLFLDEANRFNPVPHLGEYEASNPCGEQNLLPYDVCNLGSINIGAYVIINSLGNTTLDWDRMRTDIHVATHFLDNVIDANKFPLPEIAALANRIRRIGLGLMGFADALIRLGIPYNSEQGIEFGRDLQAFIDGESKCESERLANERGAFPEWARSIWGPDETCARNVQGDRIRPMRKLRNCNVTTVAPTGTISIIAGCSSGIEPLFAVAFMRNQADTRMADVNEDFVRVAKTEGWYSADLMERIAQAGHIHFPEVPEKWQRVFVTAHDITPEWHVRMQAAFQEHCDSAISKTCNFPHSATRDDVRAIYELAHELKCKGVTVYRDGSRNNQVLSTGATTQSAQTAVALSQEAAELQAELAESKNEVGRLTAKLHAAESEHAVVRSKRERPDLLRGTTIRKETPLGTMFTNITEDDRGNPFEVFINLGKAGGAAMADAEAMGRLISLALRSGIPLREVHKQLRGISSDRAVGFGPNKVLSVPDAIGIAIEEWLRSRAGVQQELLPAMAPVGDAAVVDELISDTAPLIVPLHDHYADRARADYGRPCPECGSSSVYESEGCEKCVTPGCGYSAC
ncbi:MAG: vitamin B12-dependent ribonucleotide reductase [Gemmatimonadaceae bacterium]